ncbi:MAG TPA: hypothetical protein DCY20_07145 [Firmicutes bacterium]|nr:hypothetical protein [Bacillota bacterium]
MDKQLEEFKLFVRDYPGLREEVRSGRATWQSLFEEWYLYGPEDGQWAKYKDVKTSTSSSSNNSNNSNTSTTTNETTSSSSSTSAASNLSGSEMVGQVFQYIQKMDMNKVQQTMGTVQQFVKIFQTMQGGKGAGAGSAINAATQRQPYPGLFSKFDD